MLTRKQHKLLVFICKFVREEGVAPSCEEMREAMGLKSKSGVHRLVSTLAERGYVRRLPHRARAMEVLRPPPGVQAAAAVAAAAATQPRMLRVISGGEGGEGGVRADETVGYMSLQGVRERANEAMVRGRIAAGAPLEAIQRDDMGVVNVPNHLLRGVRGEIFALEVDGDSMRDAGILDGDMAILEAVSHARDGDIVVALVDGDEATLKTFRGPHGEGVVSLAAANPDYPTRSYSGDRVAIQGRLIGIIRRYG